MSTTPRADSPHAAEVEHALDRAYERFDATADEYRDGLTNHGPMAAEALAVLGAEASRIDTWSSAYLERLEPAPENTSGQPDAGGDPLAPLRDAWPELVEGWAAAAFHAPIRVAHASRALGRVDGPCRRRELQRGIAYWRRSHQRIAGADGIRVWRGDARDFDEGLISILQAFDALPRTSAEARAATQGLITERLSTTDELPGFAETVAGIEVDLAHHELLLSALAGFCARASLQVPRARFTYLHGLTGTAALRRLGRALGVDALGRALPHHLAALAAVHASHHEGAAGIEGSPMLFALPDAPAPTPESLRAHALRDEDEHTIKFVEAALDEFDLGGDPALLWAVQRWCDEGFG